MSQARGRRCGCTQSASSFRRRKKKKNAVNILGATPLDFSVNGQVQSIARRLTEGGFSVQSVWAMGSEIAAIDRAGEAEVNLVVSSVGLPAAEFLRERFGMPYVVGAPLGDTVSALLRCLEGDVKIENCEMVDINTI